ncbi:MAG: phosphatidate cytidylyltransferase [Planctomycetota bacterium]
MLLFFLIAVVQFSDVFQYVFGKLGTPARWRAVSHRAWEGLLGGGALRRGPRHRAVVDHAVPSMAGRMYGSWPSSWPVSSGGLVPSAVKRSLGAKDWGTMMIEGHGGALDTHGLGEFRRTGVLPP